MVPLSVLQTKKKNTDFGPAIYLGKVENILKT